MKRVEALADAIATHNGYNDPESLFYKLRNPGALKGFIERHKKDDSGYRRFDSHIDGYRALLHDLHCKIEGKSTFGLGPRSPLLKVMPHFGVSLLESEHICEFINKALNLPLAGVDDTTTLAFFQE